MASSRSNLPLALIVTVLAFAIDQASKYYITDILALPLGTFQPVIEGILSWLHIQNFGINFGIGGGVSRYLLIGISVIVSLALLIWSARHPRDRIFAIGIGLIVGGALGNAFDRAMIGAVTDFLNVTCCGINNPFAFNIADVTIFAGVVLLLVRTGGDDAKATQT